MVRPLKAGRAPRPRRLRVLPLLVLVVLLGTLVPLGIAPSSSAIPVPTFGTKHVFACGSASGVTTSSGAMATIAGDSLVVLVELSQATAVSVSAMSDTAVDTFVFIHSVTNAGNARIELWVVNSSAGAANNRLTVSWGSSVRFCVSYLDFAPNAVRAFAVYDAHGAGSTATNTTCVDTVTTTQAADLLVFGCFVRVSATFTAAGSTTVNDSSSAAAGSGVMGTKVQAVAGATDAAITTTSGAWAAMVVAVQPPAVPSAPTGLHVSAHTGTTVTIAYTNPPGGAAAYSNSTLYEYASSSCATPYAASFTPSALAASVQATGLTPNTTYGFKVGVWNVSGQGVSACQSGSTLAPATAVRNPTIGTVTSSTIPLTWTLPSGESLANVTVYRWTAATCAGTSTPTSLNSGTATGLTAGGLAGATQYSFEVMAWNGTGQGPASLCVHGTTLPGPVTGLSFSAVTPTSFTASWSNPTGAIANNSAARTTTACTGSWTFVSTVGAATSKGLTGLSPATNYCVAVQAYSSSGAGAPTFGNQTTLPNAPGSFIATFETAAAIGLSWTLASGTLANQSVEWSKGSCAGPWTYLSEGTSATSAVITGLSQATTYCVALTAYSAGGQGAPAFLNATTAARVPAPPTGLRVTGQTQQEISLSWVPPPGTVTGFLIVWGYRCDALAWSLSVGRFNGSTVAGLVQSTTYCFEVGAYNATGLSNFSAAAVATTQGNSGGGGAPGSGGGTGGSPGPVTNRTPVAPTFGPFSLTFPILGGGLAIAGLATMVLADRTRWRVVGLIGLVLGVVLLIL